MDTIETWKLRVQTYTSGYTDLEMTAIAQNCYVAERTGGNAAVWHQAARFSGHECSCVPCMEQQRLYEFKQAIDAGIRDYAALAC